MTQFCTFLSSSKTDESTTTSIFSVAVEPRYNVYSAPLGGYVMTLAIDAAMQALDRAAPGKYPDPLSLTCYFLAPTPNETVTVIVRTNSDTRTKTMAMYDGEVVSAAKKICLRFQGYFADFSAIKSTPLQLSNNAIKEAVESDLVLRPAQVKGKLLSPESYPIRPDMTVFENRQEDALPRVNKTLETRMYNVVDNAVKKPALEAFMRHVSLPMDTIWLPSFLDAFPPIFFVLHRNPERVTWVPTLEMTVYFRAPKKTINSLPPRSFVRLTNVGHALDETTGMWLADCNCYSEDGNLLAVSRQRLRILSSPLPPPQNMPKPSL